MVANNNMSEIEGPAWVEVKCSICSYEWNSILPDGSEDHTALECPCCGEPNGVVKGVK